MSEEEQEEEQEVQQKETITDANEFNKWVNKQETDINNELFKNYFKFQRPSDMFRNLYQTNDIKKNNKLVSVIFSGLKDLKEEIKEMSEAEKENEKPDKIVEIVREILKFNKKTKTNS